MRLTPVLPLLLSLAACAGPADQPDAPEGPNYATPGADGWYDGTTLDGATEVRWRGTNGAVPTNELFSLEVELEEAGAPLAGAVVGVSAFMPGHGHGMNYVPQSTDLGDGRYRVDGMLFHMPGFWELYVDVVRDGVASRASFDLDL